MRRIEGAERRGQEDDAKDTSSDSAEERDDADQAEFFNPGLDDEDAAWVVQQRQGRRSDALLSCPGCLTTCCIDCQRHEDNPGQYRAMFVTNCRVDFETELLFPAESQKSRKRGREKENTTEIQKPRLPSDVFHPVFCQLCNTRLGVHDSEDVFHLTSVIASEA